MDSIQSIINQFAEKKILIIGDVMIDTYLIGHVDRISPESPVPVVDVHTTENRLGGAANVALNIKALGAEPILCSVTGADTESKIFLRLLEEKNLTKEGICTSPKRVTTNKTRILCRNHQMMRFDKEQKDDLSPEDSQMLFDRVKSLLHSHQVNAIIFQDYNKGVLTPNLIHQLITLAKKENIPTAVDPKKKNFLAFEGVTLFKPNLREVNEALQLELDPMNEKRIEAAAAQLKGKLKSKYILITLSDKGIFILNDGHHETVPAHEVRHVADVSGAGDTVISIVSLGMALGLPMNLTAQLANIGGGLVCEEVGVVPVNKDQFVAEAAYLFK